MTCTHHLARNFNVHYKSCINLRIVEIKPYWIELNLWVLDLYNSCSFPQSQILNFSGRTLGRNSNPTNLFLNSSFPSVGAFLSVFYYFWDGSMPIPLWCRYFFNGIVLPVLYEHYNFWAIIIPCNNIIACSCCLWV